MRRHLYLLVCTLLLPGVMTAAHKTDSTFRTYRKHGLHLLVSLNPILNLSKKDNPANFFYSKIPFELQYNYKRHTLGFSINGKSKKSKDSVNGLPNETKRLRLFLSPSYSYLVFQRKHWQIYSGLAYIYQYEDTFKTFKSDVEVISKHSMIKENGFSIFSRIHYRFNRKFSLALETAIYLTRTRTEFVENYPLTPSMSTHHKSPYNYRYIFFIPSNLFIRYSF